MNTARSIAQSPPRRVSGLHATALVVANMVGTGVFTTSGVMLHAVGDPRAVLTAWALGGVLALCGAAVYAELGAMLPRSGGEYVYLKRAFHPAVGFLSGWISLVVGFSAPIAASAVAFALYLKAVWPALHPTATALGLIVAASALHAAHVTWGSRVQTGFTVLKIALILLLVVGGMASDAAQPARLWTPGEQGFDPGGLALALVLVSYSYAGYNAAAYVAGEVRAPGRNLPRALLWGTALVVLLYLALNAVFLVSAPPQALAGKAEIGHVATRALFGERAGRALSLAIGLALVSSVSAMVMAGPRVYAAMAEDGLFFRTLARRGKHTGPTRAIALQALLAAAMAATASFEWLLTYIGFTLSCFAALTVIAAFVLRRREPDLPRPYRATAWPYSGLAFLALSTWMAVSAVIQRPFESLSGVATLLVGLLLYAVWRRRA